VLSYYRGVRRRDVAVIMDMSTEAFESLLFRARRALQLQLSTLDDELGGAARSRTAPRSQRTADASRWTSGGREAHTAASLGTVRARGLGCRSS